MSLTEKARADWQAITSNENDFGVSITIETPDGSSSAMITGLHTKRRLPLDTMGNDLNSKKAHISFSEALLVAEGYTVRSSSDEVNLIGHKVTVKDSTGDEKHYVIGENHPDETVGVIVCILNDYAAD